MPIGSLPFAPPSPPRLSKVEKLKKKKIRRCQTTGTVGSQLWVPKGAARSSEVEHTRVQPPRGTLDKLVNCALVSCLENVHCDRSYLLDGREDWDRHTKRLAQRLAQRAPSPLSQSVLPCGRTAPSTCPSERPGCPDAKAMAPTSPAGA